MVPGVVGSWASGEGSGGRACVSGPSAESCVTQNGRSGFVILGRSWRWRALKEATNCGMRAVIWACVVDRRCGGRKSWEERGCEGRRTVLRTVHQIGIVVERASGIPGVVVRWRMW